MQVCNVVIISYVEDKRDPFVLVEFADGIFVAPAYNVRSCLVKDEYEFEAKWSDGNYYGCMVLFEGTFINSLYICGVALKV